MMYAFVGSGGKTTLLKQTAETFRKEGKTVLVTPSTHMFIEPDSLLTDDADTIIRKLQDTGYAMAGIPNGIKLSPLSKQTFDAVCPHADVVLVEADGSKMLPLSAASPRARTLNSGRLAQPCSGTLEASGPLTTCWDGKGKGPRIAP